MRRRGLLARECPPALLRAHIKDLSAADPLWDHLKEFSELGIGPTVDLCVFMEELGFVAAPGPFFASAVLGAPLLDALDSDLLPKVLNGAQTVTVALAGADGQWVMNAEAGGPSCEAATVDLVVAVAGDGTVVLLDHPSVRRVETIDTARPLYEVDASAGGTSIGRIDPATLDEVLAHATVALAAEMVGTARRLLAMTLQYAKDRHQFGVPIGSFQAVQHKLADMSLDVERAWSAVYYAAMTVEVGDDDRHRAVHVAGAAGEAAARGQGRHSDPRRDRVHGSTTSTSHAPRLRLRGAPRRPAGTTTASPTSRSRVRALGPSGGPGEMSLVDVGQSGSKRRPRLRRVELEALKQYSMSSTWSECRLAGAGPDAEHRQTSEDVDPGGVTSLRGEHLHESRFGRRREPLIARGEGIDVRGCRSPGHSRERAPRIVGEVPVPDCSRRLVEDEMEGPLVVLAGDEG